MNQQLSTYRSDPLAFALDLRIMAGGRVVRFGDVAADFQRERFAALAPALLAVAKGEQPLIGRHWWECTKGGSKTEDAGKAIVWALAFCPRPIDIQIAAADRDQAGEARKSIRDLLYHNRWLAGTLTADNWQITNSRTESAAEIIAADVAGSHGARPDILFVDELCHIQKREFCENLLDNAAKMPCGLCIIATNAGFVGTWPFRWRENARLSDRWYFHKFSEPAPWLNPADIEEARRRNTPTRYNRLWRGVWESGIGDAFDPADVAAAVDFELMPAITAPPWHACGAGLDLGIKHDHSALVTIGVCGKTRRARLLTCESWKPRAGCKVDLEAVEYAVLQAHRRFNLQYVRYDPFQCESISQRLRRRGVPMIEVPFVGKNQNDMATTMLDVFRSRLLDLYDDHDLASDLARLTIVEKSYGYKLEAYRDEAGHADRAFALALALLGFKSLVDAAPADCPLLPIMSPTLFARY